MDAEVAELLTKFDTDGNGVIDYEEFLAAIDDDEGSRDKTWMWAQRHEIYTVSCVQQLSPLDEGAYSAVIKEWPSMMHKECPLVSTNLSAQ